MTKLLRTETPQDGEAAPPPTSTWAPPEPLDAADMTWSGVNATLHATVLYADVRVRDWRWLWLRHKTVTRLMDWKVL
jgi:hypothetical protein